MYPILGILHKHWQVTCTRISKQDVLIRNILVNIAKMYEKKMFLIFKDIKEHEIKLCFWERIAFKTSFCECEVKLLPKVHVVLYFMSLPFRTLIIILLLWFTSLLRATICFYIFKVVHTAIKVYPMLCSILHWIVVFKEQWYKMLPTY